MWLEPALSAPRPAPTGPLPDFWGRERWFSGDSRISRSGTGGDRDGEGARDPAALLAALAVPRSRRSLCATERRRLAEGANGRARVEMGEKGRFPLSPAPGQRVAGREDAREPRAPPTHFGAGSGASCSRFRPAAFVQTELGSGSRGGPSAAAGESLFSSPRLILCVFVCAGGLAECAFPPPEPSHCV